MHSINSITLSILQHWSAKGKITEEEIQQLLVEELAVPQRAKAFGITQQNGQEKIKERSHLLKAVYSDVIQFCHSFGLGESDQILTTLWNLWLPLAIQLASEREKLNRALVQGILGGQGTGKTTLAAVSCLILKQLGYSTLSLSLDDLYKTYGERQLLQQKDPRLIWRGPPGTHDVDLGIQLLEQLRQPNREKSILVPRFDKSACNGAGDRSEPEIVSGIDIVLFEGWFVGVVPIAEGAFENPPLPIVTPEERLFALDMNEQLRVYLPLWELLDRLIVLYPVDYRLSKQWRKEAEQKMMATGKSGMSDREIEEFVDYFWRSLHPELFITPLIKNPNMVDMVIEINRDHSTSEIYRHHSS